MLRNTLIGGTLFLLLYAVFMLMLTLFAPSYIEAVWNLPSLSGVLLGGIPLEELAFAFTFGAGLAFMSISHGIAVRQTGSINNASRNKFPK